MRTALYNYLFAKKHGGQFLLRIEDTDQTRYVDFAEQYIIDALRWLGIEPDEGHFYGGPHAPYRQSERTPIYQKYAQQLLDADLAYYAFDTAEELDAMREKLKAARVPNPQYNSVTRTTMRNSLTLPEAEVKALIESGAPYVIRLKVPRKEEIRLNDLIRGWVMVHSTALDDKVLLKSDGLPTYHLANVVDDHEMGITHVIRGEEWLPSAPLHVLLYKSFGWEDTMPKFAHLPLLLKPDGNGKLSKRDGEMHGFPVFPLEWTNQEEGSKRVSGFREEGYLPEALLNFLALLGWNPGTNQELFTLEEMVEAFSIERISKSGAKFDIAKAKWFNQHYLHQKTEKELGEALQAQAKEHGQDISLEFAMSAAALVKERVTFTKELYPESSFLFASPSVYDQEVATKKWDDAAVSVIKALAAALDGLNQINPEEAKNAFNTAAETAGQKAGKVTQALRLAVTGRGAGPDLMTIISLLGPAETKARLEKAAAELKPVTA